MRHGGNRSGGARSGGRMTKSSSLSSSHGDLAARPSSAMGSIQEDSEVAAINNPRSHKGPRRSRADRRARTTQDYYPSSRRSKAMWNEGVQFTSPHPGRFQLPSLPSVADLNSGMRDLEVWPSGQTASQGESQSSSGNSRGSGSKLAKPKLLLELESYVAQQLFLVEGERGVVFNQQEFEVYRNVFQFFIDKLHTYRPLLAVIKLEYELLLDDHMQRLQAVEPIKGELASLEDSLAMELGTLMVEHKEALDKLKKKNGAKDRDIERLRTEETAMRKETSRAEVDIQAIEERRQQVHQSNIALVGSLRFYEDWLQQFTRPENYDSMLKETQAEVTRGLQEMEKLKHAVEEKVEREELDIILSEMRVLREKCLIKDRDLNNMEVLVDRTVKSCAGLEEDVKKLEAQVTGLTPRPSWPELSMQALELGGKKTDGNIETLTQAIRELQKEIMALRDDMPPELQSDDEEEEADEDWVDMEYFTGQGLGEDVPRYYRHEGRIKNRKMSKRDTELLIKHFWKQKDQIDGKRPKRMPVGEWFYDFLQKKYGPSQDAIADWSHNMVDASLRYKYDADCEMFWKVITDQLDESVYWDEYEMTNGFLALLQKLDMNDTGGKVTGRLAKATLLKAMRKWFPNKTDIRFNKLKRALSKEEAAQGAKVHYVHLFAEDKDFNQGPFAEMVRDQHLEEREEYLDDLESALRERAKGEEPLVTAQQCQAALTAMDPKKGEREKDIYVRNGFALPKGEKVTGDRTIAVDTFMENLSRGVVKTATKRDEVTV